MVTNIRLAVHHDVQCSSTLDRIHVSGHSVTPAAKHNCQFNWQYMMSCVEHWQLSSHKSTQQLVLLLEACKILAPQTGEVALVTSES
jgi:hypothetical protein